MRKLIVLSMISLDGVLQAPGEPQEDTSGDFRYGGWSAPYTDEAFVNVLKEQLKPAEYLLGRKTFDIWEGYWPQHADEWQGINEGIKYVFSNTRDKSDWKNTVFIKDLEAIEKLKKSTGPDIQVWGSGELIQLLLEHDLVDELWLKIYPLTLGKGKKLFEDGTIAGVFTLMDSSATPSGVIIANYKRNGKLKETR